MKSYLKALRINRWPRSASILIGTGAYWALTMNFSTDIVGFLPRIVVAFFLTWAISTANYVINEIVDAPFDAHHPDKKDRPLVHEEVRVEVLLLIFSLLVISTFAGAILVFKRAFFLSLLALLLAGFVYNLRPVRLKDRAFIDSISESVNNPIRFLIGWYALGSSFPDPFLLLSWWMLGNFLMVGKRYSELLYLGKERARKYRRSFNFYTEKNLKVYLFLSAFLFLTSFLIFCWRQGLKFTAISSVFSLSFMFSFYKRAERESVEEPESVLMKSSLLFSASLFFFSLIVGIFLDNINL